MPLVQITYDVPLEIYKALALGELNTLGTAAVRNSTGITGHIREVSRTMSSQESAVARTLVKGLKNPKVIVVGLGVIAVAAVGSGVAGWAASRKQWPAEPGVPECIERYNVSLSSYLEAINEGNLDADLLARLISDLDAVKENSDSGTISLEFSVEEVAALVNLVADYTHRLAEANAVELSPLNETKSNSGVGAVSDLRRYLEMQREILNQAA